MEKNSLNRKKILEMIQNRKITPEEGLKLIAKLQAKPKENPVQESTGIVYSFSDWKQSGLKSKAAAKAALGKCLIFDTKEYLFNKAKAEGIVNAILVKPGNSFRQFEGLIYEINPSSQEDYQKLAASLKQQGLMPETVIHTWSDGSFSTDMGVLKAQIEKGMYSLFYLSKALMDQKSKDKVQLFYLYSALEQDIQPQYSAVGGFAKSIRLENPKYSYKTIAMGSTLTPENILDTIVNEASSSTDDIEIRYENGVRYVKGLVDINIDRNINPALLKNNGVYLITGGAGGLGLIFADYIARKINNARLVFTGRSDLNAEKQKQVKQIESLGAEVVYIKADVSKADDVERLIKEAKSRFKNINGVIHCAGVIKDSFILKKTKEEMDTVISAKVHGAINLSNAIRNQNIDFVVLFSSITGIIGNVGQSDYAYANSFMDNFAKHSMNTGSTKVVSINWPLWNDGGMNLDDKSRAIMKKTFGFVPLSTENGLKAFEYGLGSSNFQLVVLEGDTYKIREALKIGSGEEQLSNNPDEKVEYVEVIEQSTDDGLTTEEQQQLLKRTEGYLREMLSKVTKIPVDEIDPRESFEMYGLDSVTAMSLGDELESDFGELSKTLLFEYQNLEELASFFIDSYEEVLMKKLGEGIKTKPAVTKKVVPVQKKAQVKEVAVPQEIKTVKAVEIKKVEVEEVIEVEVESGELDGDTKVTLQKKTEEYLREMLSKVTKIPVEEIDPRESFEMYGLDSVTAMGLGDELESEFGELSKTLLFEYQNLEELAEFFVESYLEVLTKKFGLGAKTKVVTKKVVTVQQSAPVYEAPVAVEKVVPYEEEVEVVEEIVEEEEDSESGTVDVQQLQKKTEDYLRNLLSKITKIPVEEIDPRESFEMYGLDSVTAMSLGDELESDFGELSKTLLFEYQNLEELAEYFVDSYRDALVKKLGADIKPKEKKVKVVTTVKPVVKETIKEASVAKIRSRFASVNVDTTASNKIETVVESKEYAKTVEVRPAEKRVDSEDIIPVEKYTAAERMAYIPDDDIAIIGLSGKFPKARNLDEFWDNLTAGKDCITEIPKERWDSDLYYDSDKDKLGTTCSKWGGFLDDVDKFDAMFFNISSREAHLMDPQERLYLEASWHAIEDAGYTRNKLDKYRVGVYAGAMYGQYQLLPAEVDGRPLAHTSIYASIANRVSYFLNLHGPSIALDTMCSSSLTAIHLACDSIKKGESDMALAGGVNVTIHPDKYLFLNYGKFLSTDGRCRSFGEGGDGYVPSEGVGIVVLKSLKKAIEDRDQIYAVIKGTSINHGGKTSGYTVPNPNAQGSLIAETLKKSGVNPRTINYLEAHGTGTGLGDPIEITGLMKSFGEYTKDKQFCSIGSVKSNVGHLESAAGIAAIAKVLMQMKYKKMVPSILSERTNPNITFADTPFYVQHAYEDWNNPVVIENGVKKVYPRRAGVSSFGAGGANAHIILEEYDVIENNTSKIQGSQVVVMSARNDERLKDYAKDMVRFLERAEISYGSEEIDEEKILGYIEKELCQITSKLLKISAEDLDATMKMEECGFDPVIFSSFAEEINNVYATDIKRSIFAEFTTIEEVSKFLLNNYKDSLVKHYPDCVTKIEREVEYNVELADVAYTFQTGREAMASRIALVVSNVKELKGKLQLFIQGKTRIENVFTGNTKTNKDKQDLLVEGREGQEFLKIILNDRKLPKVAQLWVAGVEIDWEVLHSKQSLPRRISLPTYPFEKERFWVPENSRSTEVIAQELKKQKPDAPVVMYFRNVWERSNINIAVADQANLGNIVIFDTNDSLSNNLKTLASQVVVVKPGESFKNTGSSVYEINPTKLEDYTKLFEELKQQNIMPDRLVHMWSAYAENYNDTSFSADALEAKYLSKGLYSVFHMIKAVAEAKFKALSRITVVYSGEAQKPNPFGGALAGYSKSLGLVLPNVVFSTVEVVEGTNAAEAVSMELKVQTKDSANEVRYENAQRFVKQVKALELENKQTQLRNKGVYLVTGGVGALGLIYAKYLAEKCQAKVVLLGRSALDSKKEKMLNDIKALGGEALYLQADTGSIDSMKSVVAAVKNKFGSINGIIHAAGISSDKIIMQKELNDFKYILNPKLQGTIILDEVTRTEDLDFFMMFSSTSSILGDFGQCDYAIGNRFIDCYSEYREALRSKGKCKGRTISVNWPLWKDGGMHLNKDAETLYLQSSGMVYLETKNGIEAFERILSGDNQAVMVLAGIQKRIEKFLKISSDEQPAKKQVAVKKIVKKKVEKPKVVKDDGSPVEQKVLKDIRSMAADLLQMKPEKLDINENLGDFGFDSITLKAYSDKLSETYNVEVTPTVFFAHSSIANLAEFLLNEFGEQVKGFYNTGDAGQPGQEDTEEVYEEQEVIEYVDEVETEETSAPTAEMYCGTKVVGYEPVAIIGASGLFPGSKDLNEFWKNLENEKDLITEIPSDRWDWREYFSEDIMDKNKTNSKWGGFITDVDKFDAQFFNTSPREAQFMDPQHRLFLQTAWKTIEDGGYKASQLSGKNVGVFVGVQFNDYQQLVGELGDAQPQMGTGNAHSMLGNRVSFLLNFRGPSESIDTACSSSLVALHRAVKSIQHGESEVAIAGGVSLMLVPGTTLSAGKLGILSRDGRCKTFDKRANGYVRGEGVGSLLLKPLSKAIEDNDYIYAVIKGTAENHGGKANSLTAPNSSAQSEVLIKAYEEAKFDPETISYIETHGTGTELGDPVEIDGIKKAFKDMYKNSGKSQVKESYCGVGSVKTNIGHLEPAAGMAGVIKVILAMKNKKLPGNVHLQEINPYIDIKGAPVYIVNKTKPWERITDAQGNPVPRRAGISSFGFGGTNAHIAVEEYEASNANGSAQENEPQLIILSAKNGERLKEYAEDMMKFIVEINNPQKDSANYIHISEMAYTLQTGREDMDERLTLEATDYEDLKEKLSQYCQGKNNVKNLFTGNVKRKGISEDFAENANIEEAVKVALNSKKLTKLAQLWVSGADIEWQQMYNGRRIRRMPLPTYPFARQRHWIPEIKKNTDSVSVEAKLVARIHPLIDSNESTFDEQCFKKTLSDKEAYIRDNVVDGIMTLPGLAGLEIARAAGNLANRKAKTVSLEEIVWIEPKVASGSSKEFQISLYPEGDMVEYELFTPVAGEQRNVYSQGRLFYGSSNAEKFAGKATDIGAVKQRCSRTNGAECYKVLEARGMKYGATYQVIQEMYSNEKECLARLTLPKELKGYQKDFDLNPAILEGALQVAAYLMSNAGNRKGSAYSPVSLDGIYILKALPDTCNLHVVMSRDKNENTFDVFFTDDSGQQIVIMKGLQIEDLSTAGSSEDYNDDELISLLQRLESSELDVDEVDKLTEEILNG